MCCQTIKKVLTFHRPVSDTSDKFGGLKTNFACGSDLPLSEFLNEIRNIDHSRVFVSPKLFAFFNLFFRHITWPMADKNFLTSSHDFSPRFTLLGKNRKKKSKFLIPFHNLIDHSSWLYFNILLPMVCKTFQSFISPPCFQWI